MRKSGWLIISLALTVRLLLAATALQPVDADTPILVPRAYFPLVARSPATPIHDFEQQVIDLINRERTARGLAPLQVDDRLMRAARRHSQDMATNNFVSHTGSDGSSPWDRIRQEGYPLGPGGETIAAGYPDPASVVAGWRASPPHWSILMGGYRDVGVGYAFNANSRYDHYWTADLGTRWGSTTIRPSWEEGPCDDVASGDESVSGCLLTVMSPSPGVKAAVAGQSTPEKRSLPLINHLAQTPTPPDHSSPTPPLPSSWPASTPLPDGSPLSLSSEAQPASTQPASLPLTSRAFLPLIIGQTGSYGFPVSAAPEYQSAPAIWGPVVVWQDSRSGRGDDIYGYDLRTGVEFAITTTPGNQSQPAIWEHIVVWQDNRHGDWDIYGYDLDTHAEFPVHVGPGNQQDPAVFGDVVVWHDNRNGSWDIYGYNLSAQTEFPVSTASGDQVYPAIWSNRVVWGDGRKGGYDFNVHGRDLRTGQEFVVTDAPLNQDRPAIWEHIVVWQDWRNWRMDIYGKDLSTGQEFPISQDPADEFAPAIWGDLIVWEERGCHNGDVYGYHLPSRTRFPVVTAPLPQTAPAVWGDVIVWQDNRSGVADIYGYRWAGSPPPNPPTALPSPTGLLVGAFPGGQVQVRWSYAGSDHLGFRVERSSGFTPGEYTTVATLGPDARSHTDRPPVLEETYWYRVHAYNASNQSDYCDEAYTATFEEAPNWDERYLLLLINEARADPANAGYPEYAPRPPLAHNPLLNYAARSHSQAILNSGFRIGHCDLIGRCPSERAWAVGYEGGVAENLIVGQDGPDWVENSHRAFMSSQGHRDNLMCECFNEAGIGHAYDPAKGNAYWHGQYTETFSGRPGVQIPNLPTGIVIPYEGAVFTTFTYLVNYYHPKGLAPMQASVYVDGLPHAMTLRSGQPANGTYQYNMTLSAGFAHNYYFAFQFPGGSARLPETGSYLGPDVWPDQADLAVWPADISADPPEPRAGYPDTLRAWVRNEGTQNATEVAVRFLAGGQPVGEVRLARVEAGQGAEARVTWTPTTVGQINVEVQVDPANAISEWREANNRAGRTLTIIAPRIWYVDGAAAESGDGTTPQTPFRTIREGLVAARAGDRVMVAAGTYRERVSIPRHVQLIGAGAEATTIHGDGTDSVVGIGPGGLIEGFTITGSGPGYFDSGIWHSQGIVTVRRNRLVSNSVGIFSWCFQDDCEALLIAENNLFVGNSRVAVDANGPPVHRLVNNTVVGNGRGFVLNNPASLAENNIVVGNSGDGLAGHSGVTVRYNDVWGNGRDYSGPLPGPGSISADPRFVDAAAGDYRLQPGSPCINAGNPDPAYNDVDGSRNDMGAYLSASTGLTGHGREPRGEPGWGWPSPNNWSKLTVGRSAWKAR